MKRHTLAINVLSIGVLGIFAATPKRSVTVTEGTNVNVTLSPDHKTIIMDLQETLWSLPIAGGVAKRLTDPFLEPTRPDWSPKGGLVAFQSFKGGTFHISLMKPDGTGLRQLTEGHGDERDPRFSPDGKKIDDTQIVGNKARLMISDEAIGTADDVFPFPTVWISPTQILYTGNGKIFLTTLGGDTKTIPFQAKFEFNRAPYKHRELDFD